MENFKIKTLLDVLDNIPTDSIQSIWRNTNLSDLAVRSMVFNLRQHGLVKMVKKGRHYDITLTKDGEEVKKLCRFFRQRKVKEKI